MNATNLARDERDRRISNAQELAAAGFVEHAVRHYIAAGEPAMAASVLVDAGRLGDAIDVLDRHGDQRPHRIMAAALRQRAGHDSHAALEGLGPLSVQERAHFERFATPASQPVTKPEVSISEDKLTEATQHAARARQAVTQRETMPPRHARFEAPVQTHLVTPPRGRTTPPPLPPRGARRAAAGTLAGVHPAHVPPATLPPANLPPANLPPRSGSLPLSTLPPPPALPTGVTGSTVTRPSGIYMRERGAPPPLPGTVERSIMELLQAGRVQAAGRLAFKSGRYGQALLLFEEVSDSFGVGISLSALGQHEHAIAKLCEVPADSVDYRHACRMIVRSARGMEKLDAAAWRCLGPYIQAGPRSTNEVQTYLDLAELLWLDGQVERARDTLQRVLLVAPEDPGVKRAYATWGAGLADGSAEW